MEHPPFDKERFQRMNRAVRPDGWLLQKTKAAMCREREAPRCRRRTMVRCAASLAACAAVAAGLLLLPPSADSGTAGGSLPGTSAVPEPVPASSAPEALGFQLKLHLSSADGGKTPNLMESEQIQEGTTFRWGKLRITRSREVYTNSETGEKYYGTVSEGFAPFLSIDGENIATVEATAEHGTVSFMTESYQQHLEEDGSHYEELFSFTAPRTAWENMFDYWNSDACAEWRKKVEELHPVMRAGESLCFEAVDDTAAPMTVRAQIRWIVPHAPEVIDYARDGRILYMNWDLGRQAWEELTRYPAVPYEEVEADTLTITVTFTDGRVESQSIRLSLDKEGYVVAEALA